MKTTISSQEFPIVIGGILQKSYYTVVNICSGDKCLSIITQTGQETRLKISTIQKGVMGDVLIPVTETLFDCDLSMKAIPLTPEAMAIAQNWLKSQ